MRQPEYLSPSAIAKWLDGVEGYYLYYLTDNRPPRELQNQAMAVGSALDAFIKAYLHEKLFGRNHTDSNKFELKTIFEAQVEAQNRPWAWQNGAYAFEMYKQSGALLDLLSDLQAAKTNPRFEFEVRGAINGYREGMTRRVEDVILLGKPDCSYVNSSGVHVILDFKINGYCSNHPVSPMPGYIRVRGANGCSAGHHKLCSPFELGGMTINNVGCLEDFRKDWARQLAIYSWLCGEEIGSDFIVAIDQCVCKPVPGEVPEIRVAEHRLRISEAFQWATFELAAEIWEITHSEHIFRELSLKESQARCGLLDQQAAVLYGQIDSIEDVTWIQMTRK